MNEQLTPAIAPEDPDCIVAIRPCCNRVVFASVNIPQAIDRETKRTIGTLAAEGCTISHWPASQVRIAEWGCKCKKPNAA